jgi:hypothetical protein
VGNEICGFWRDFGTIGREKKPLMIEKDISIALGLRIPRSTTLALRKHLEKLMVKKHYELLPFSRETVYPIFFKTKAASAQL